MTFLSWIPVIVLLVPMLAAPLAFWLGKKDEQHSFTCLLAVSSLVFILTLICFIFTYDKSLTLTLPGICGLGLQFSVGGFRSLFTLIASAAWLVVSVFCPSYFQKGDKTPRFVFFTLLTFGATLGLFYADTLYTSFVCFEMMSLMSYPWVVQTEQDEAMKAGQTYLFISVAGGLCMLMGLFLLPMEMILSSYATMPTTANVFLPATLLLVGFGAKAGAYPLHVWMPATYSLSPAPASALLSSILSKAGVVGCVLLVTGVAHNNASFANMMFFIGVITMVWGALCAVFSTDLKRTLANSSMSQIGFILQGVGLIGLLGHHNGLAVFGTVGHMVNHSLFKLVFFLCAGVIFSQAKTLKLEKLQGFGRNKPILHACFLLCVLGIAGVPMFSGYISKSLLHEAVLELMALDANNMYAVAETLFVISGGLTLCYMLKLYLCLFWQKNPTQQTEYDAMKKNIPVWPNLLLLACSLLVLVIGLFPEATVTQMGLLSLPYFHGEMPTHMPIAYYGAANLIGASKSIFIGVVAFALLCVWLTNKRKAAVPSLEMYFYRPLISLCTIVLGHLAWLLDHLTDAFVFIARAVGGFVANVLNGMPDNGLVLTRKTALSPIERKQIVPVGTRFSYAIGYILDGIVTVLNATVRRKNPIKTHFVSVLAAGMEEIAMEVRLLSRSISFGLLLFCIGLFGTLAYLVFL